LSGWDLANFFLGWPQTPILLTLTSQVVVITLHLALKKSSWWKAGL
jgi:hypothetical protein